MLLCWYWHHYNVFFGNMCHTKPIHLLFIHVFHILAPKMTCQCQLVIRDTCSCCVVYSFLSNFTLIHKIEHHGGSLSELLGRTIDSNPCRNKHQVTCNAAIHFKITMNSTEGDRKKIESTRNPLLTKKWHRTIHHWQMDRENRQNGCNYQNEVLIYGWWRI